MPVEDASLLHSEFNKNCKSKLCHIMMTIWMKYVEIDMTQDIQKLDLEWVKDHKTSSKEYDTIHQR